MHCSELPLIWTPERKPPLYYSELPLIWTPERKPPLFRALEKGPKSGGNRGSSLRIVSYYYTLQLFLFSTLTHCEPLQRIFLDKVSFKGLQGSSTMQKYDGVATFKKVSGKQEVVKGIKESKRDSTLQILNPFLQC